jgi:hypothetical protein
MNPSGNLPSTVRFLHEHQPSTIEIARRKKRNSDNLRTISTSLLLPLALALPFIEHLMKQTQTIQSSLMSRQTFFPSILSHTLINQSINQSINQLINQLIRLEVRKHPFARADRQTGEDRRSTIDTSCQSSLEKNG